MKRLVFLLIVILPLFTSQYLQAQDQFTPWTVSLSTNAVNNPVRKLPGDKGRFKTWNLDPAGFKLGVARHIVNKLAFEANLSLNSIKQNLINIDQELSYISLDGMFKYNLTNSFIINPYATIGGGYTWLDEIGAGTVNAGVGINLYITYNFGVTAQTMYKHAFEDYGIPHFQHSAGILFKFGGADNDNDGILNNQDECPNIFGLANLNGCPDKDGDGIIDSKDNCPDNAGTLNGCPDTDKDGVSDLYDKCPQIPGDKTNKGCPLKDTDKDGIPDKHDKCPKQKGTNVDNGCPLKDTDKDGIPDKYDKCPQQKGTNVDNGCPKPNNQNTTTALKNLSKFIFFEYSKAEINKNNKVNLDKIAGLIKQSNFKGFLISGHTDNTATDEVNLKLSIARAKAVRDYLISKGVKPERLKEIGYGEERPLDTSNTDEGRRKNRRVEIVPFN